MRAERDESPAEIVAWLSGELGTQKSNFQFVRHMLCALNISLRVLMDTCDWAGFCRGGTMTDEALNELLTPLVPRSGDNEMEATPGWIVRAR